MINFIKLAEKYKLEYKNKSISVNSYKSIKDFMLEFEGRCELSTSWDEKGKPVYILKNLETNRLDEEPVPKTGNT